MSFCVQFSVILFVVLVACVYSSPQFIHSNELNLPIVDLAQTDAEIVSEIYEAATKYGFFFLVNHNISAQLRWEMFDQCTQFFNLDVEIKNSLMSNFSHSGYTPFKSFSTSELPELKSEEGDSHQSFYISDERNDNYQKDNGYASINQWPERTLMPDFQSIVAHYFTVVTELAVKMNEFMALSLNLRRDYFQSYFSTGAESVLRCIHYPPGNNRNVVGAGAHSDWGMFTFLVTDGTKGLEIQWNNEWYAISVPETLKNENVFIVNIGDALQRWTNDLFFSAKHRVILNADKERISIPLFWAPNIEAVVECLPSICGGVDRDGEQVQEVQKAIHDPIKFLDYLKFKMAEAYDYNEDENVEKSDL